VKLGHHFRPRRPVHRLDRSADALLAELARDPVTVGGGECLYTASLSRETISTDLIFAAHAKIAEGPLHDPSIRESCHAQYQICI
jgi:hypothetical protein